MMAVRYRIERTRIHSVTIHQPRASLCLLAEIACGAFRLRVAIAMCIRAHAAKGAAFAGLDSPPRVIR